MQTQTLKSGRNCEGAGPAQDYVGEEAVSQS